MILVYAGRRRLAEPQRTSSLIDDVLRRLRPRLVIGSAAAGTDLLMLKLARHRAVPAQILIPGGIDEFERTSVADVGTPWPGHYHALLDDPAVHATVVGPASTREEERYHHVNEAIVAAADRAVQQGEEVTTVIVRTRPRPTGDATEHLAELARRRDWQIIELPDEPAGDVTEQSPRST